ncbi:MAG: hypothetical protein ACTSQ4_12170 [Candidatus Heimdallarchaeaceae archaeon]
MKVSIITDINNENLDYYHELTLRTEDPLKKKELELQLVQFYAENIHTRMTANEFPGRSHPGIIHHLSYLYQRFIEYRTNDFADAFLIGFRNALNASFEVAAKREILSVFVHYLFDISYIIKEIRYTRHYASALQRLLSYSDTFPVNREYCFFPVAKIILEELSCIIAQNSADITLRNIYTQALTDLADISLKYKNEKCSAFSKQLEDEINNLKEEKYIPRCNKTFEEYSNLSYSFVLETLQKRFQTQVMRKDERLYRIIRTTPTAICDVEINVRESFRSKLDLALFLASLEVEFVDFISVIGGVSETEITLNDLPESVKELHDIQALAQISMKLGERNRFDELDEALEEIRLAYEKEKNEEYTLIYSECLKNAQIDFARKKDFDRLEKTISKFDDLYKDTKSDEVLYSFAVSLKLVILTFVKWKNQEKAETYYAKIKKLPKQTKDPQILTRLVESLYHIIYGYSNIDTITNLDKKVDELLSYEDLNIQDEHKIDFIISGVVNSLVYFGRAKGVGQIEKYLQKLKELVAEFPGDKSLIYLSHGLYTAAKYNGINQNLDKVQEFVDELEELFKTTPLNEIRTSLAIAYRNASLVFGTLGNYEKMCDFMNKITNFHEERTNKDILKEMAWVLHNSIEIYSFNNKFIEMDVLLNEFRFLNKNHPDREVRRLFIRVAKYSVGYFSKNAEKKLEKKWIKTLKEMHEY